jgi:PAS domain-containing protein
MLITAHEESARRPNDVLEHAILTSWLESSDMGLCVLDDASQIVMFNQAACTLLEIDGLTALNKPFKELFLHIDPSLASNNTCF